MTESDLWHYFSNSYAFAGLERKCIETEHRYVMDDTEHGILRETETDPRLPYVYCIMRLFDMTELEMDMNWYE